MPVSQSTDCGVPHSDYLAKYAAAFLEYRAKCAVERSLSSVAQTQHLLTHARLQSELLFVQPVLRNQIRQCFRLNRQYSRCFRYAQAILNRHGDGLLS